MAYTPTRQLTLSSNPDSIPATMPDGGQSGFVVPLHIKYGGDNWEGGASDIFANAQSGGQDLTFWSSDGLTQYSHSQPEIYVATAGSQELLCRVLVPSLSSSIATEILVQYGDATCAAQWSAGSDIYKQSDGWLMFSPMEASDGLISDWTGISSMTPISGDRTTQVDGIMGHGQRMTAGKTLGFDANDSLLRFFSQITCTFWVKAVAGGVYSVLYGAGYDDMRQSPRATDADIWTLYGGAERVRQPVAIGEWNMVAMQVLQYANGMYPGIYSHVWNSSGSRSDATYFGTEGREHGYRRIAEFLRSSTATDTIFDELQVSENILSTDWLDTQNAATRANGTFWSIGDAEAIGGVAYRRPPLAYRMGPRIWQGVM